MTLNGRPELRRAKPAGFSSISDSARAFRYDLHSRRDRESWQVIVRHSTRIESHLCSCSFALTYTWKRLAKGAGGQQRPTDSSTIQVHLGELSELAVWDGGQKGSAPLIAPNRQWAAKREGCLGFERPLKDPYLPMQVREWEEQDCQKERSSALTMIDGDNRKLAEKLLMVKQVSRQLSQNIGLRESTRSFSMLLNSLKWIILIRIPSAV